MDARLDRLAALLRERPHWRPATAGDLADLIDQSAAEPAPATPPPPDVVPFEKRLSAMADSLEAKARGHDRGEDISAAAEAQEARAQASAIRWAVGNAPLNPPPDCVVVLDAEALNTSQTLPTGTVNPPAPDVVREALEAENRRLREALEGIRTHAEQEILDWRADREECAGSPCYEVNRWSAVIAAIGKANALAATKEPTDV